MIKFEIYDENRKKDENPVQLRLMKSHLGNIWVCAKLGGIDHIVLVVDQDEGFLHRTPFVSEKFGFKLDSRGRIMEHKVSNYKTDAPGKSYYDWVKGSVILMEKSE